MARPAVGLSAPSGPVDLNAVASYNLRRARLMRQWTQKQFAEAVCELTGHRPTQASISALEIGWAQGRRREFDLHELAVYAVALDVPLLWFLLPPDGWDDLTLLQLPHTIAALPHLVEGPHPEYSRRRRTLGLATLGIPTHKPIDAAITTRSALLDAQSALRGALTALQEALDADEKNTASSEPQASRPTRR